MTPPLPATKHEVGRFIVECLWNLNWHLPLLVYIYFVTGWSVLSRPTPPFPSKPLQQPQPLTPQTPIVAFLLCSERWLCLSVVQLSVALTQSSLDATSVPAINKKISTTYTLMATNYSTALVIID